MSFLRRILPKSWHRDVDYDRTADIDWHDAAVWNESDHPRDPDGKFAVAAGGAGAVPQLTKYAGPAGAKMKAAVEQHIAAGGNPYKLAQAIHAESGKFKSSNVAGYMNQLLKHMEAHHGAPSGTFGKAKTKQVGEEGPPELPPPTDEELSKLEEQAQESPGELTPGMQEVVGSMHAESENLLNWAVGHEDMDVDEKIAWVKAAQAGIPPEATVTAGYAKSLLSNLEAQKSGVDLPPAEAKAEAEETKGAAKEAAAAVAESLPEPTTKSQKNVAAIFNDPLMSPEEKIAEISDKLGGYGHAPNLEYAEHAISLLEAQQGAVAPEPEPPGPSDSDELHNIHYLTTKSPFTTQQKIEALNENLAEGTYETPEAQEYAKKWIAKLGGTVEPTEQTSAEAEEAQLAAHEDLLKKLQAPNPHQTTQGELYEVAAHPTMSLENKIKQLEVEIDAAWKQSDKEYGNKLLMVLQWEQQHAEPVAGLIHPTFEKPDPNDFKQQLMHSIATSEIEPDEKVKAIKGAMQKTIKAANKSYGNKLINAIQSSGAAPEEEQVAGAEAIAEAKTGKVPAVPSFLKSNGALNNMHVLATGGATSAAQLQSYLSTKMANGEIIPGSAAQGVAHAMIIAKKAQEAGATPAPEPEPEKPQPPPANLPAPKPGSNTQTAMHNYAMLGMHTNTEKIANITKELANSSGSKGGAAETYANELIKALGGTPVDVDALKAAKATTAYTPPPSLGAKPTTPIHQQGTHQTPNVSKLNRAKKHEAQAIKVSHASDADAKKACTTLNRAWWNKVDSETRDACISYKGGSSAINGALRNAPGYSTNPAVQHQINLIDDLFDHEDAVLKQDIILHRGEDMDQSTIDKMIVDLNAGKIVRPNREGFTSTAAAASAPSGWTGKKVQWEITAIKGTKALGFWAADKSFNSESEVILRHHEPMEVYEIVKKGQQYIVKARTL